MAAATSSIHVLLAGLLGFTPPAEGPAGLADPGARRRLPPIDLGDPAELIAPASAGVLAAQRLADGGRYSEAAAAFAALAGDTGDVRLIYQAGSMRAKAGQYALAARHFNDYLQRASGVRDETRAYVDQRLAAARDQLVAIRIAAVEGVGSAARPIPPDVLARASLRLEPVGGAADPGTVITLPDYRGDEVFVDRTPVVVHLAIPGFMPVSQLRSASGGETTWSLVVARQKVTVDLRFSPEKAIRGARLKIQSTDGTGAPGVDQALETPALTVSLTTGNWQLEVAARRHEALTSLVVTPGMRPVPVTLQRRGRPGGQEFAASSDVVAAVLGGGFVLTAVTGLGLVIAGQVKESKAQRRNEDAIHEALLAADERGDSALDRVEEAYPTAKLHRDVDRAFNLTTAGAVVIMASLGAALAGFTVSSRVKRRAAYLEMGVGALLAGGGAAWMAYAIKRQDDLLAPTDPEGRVTWSGMRAVNGHRAGAAVLLGAGMGLVLFPALALIGDAAHQRRMRRRGLAMTPTFGQDRLGLAFSGHF